MNNKELYKIVLTAVLSAMASIAFIIESLFPPIIPGARIGISNIFILVALVLLGDRYAFCALLVKLVFGGIYSGNIASLLYSLPGGVFALAAEDLLFRSKRYSIVATSIVGSVLNLSIQNVMFCVITGYVDFFVYLPYLALIGVLAGFVVGVVVAFVKKTLGHNFRY